MIRATAILRRPVVKAERVADTIVLDHGARHRRRVSLTARGGLSFLLDLDRASVLEDGDALKLEDGRLVQVEAAPERLIEVTTGNPLRLMKVAWHLGNRHVATEITGESLFLLHDHVLLEMVRGLGATAREVERPFRPERGAYEGAPAHDHSGHDHAHGEHGGAHAHAHAGHEHAHGAACGCGHEHGQAHANDHGHAHAHAGHDHAHGAHGHDAHAPAVEAHRHGHAHER